MNHALPARASSHASWNHRDLQEGSNTCKLSACQEKLAATQLVLAVSASASALDHDAAMLTNTHAKGGVEARELHASHTALSSCPTKPLLVQHSSCLNIA